VATLVALFVVLNETHTKVTLAGVTIQDVSIVQKVIPPVVGFMTIRIVDSVVIREVRVCVLRAIVRAAYPVVDAQGLSYVAVPYTWPHKEMTEEFRRSTRVISVVDPLTTIVLFILASIFLGYAVWEMLSRFGFDVVADLSVLLTVATVVRASSAIWLAMHVGR
jgi:hypothetical protein